MGLIGYFRVVIILDKVGIISGTIGYQQCLSLDSVALAQYIATQDIRTVQGCFAPGLTR